VVKYKFLKSFFRDSRGPRIVSRRAPEFLLLCFVFSFLYIQMLCYTIMKLFITLLENVNKSRTSAGNLSLNTYKLVCQNYLNWNKLNDYITVHKMTISSLRSESRQLTLTSPVSFSFHRYTRGRRPLSQLARERTTEQA
jgi:hypothetical protein